MIDRVAILVGNSNFGDDSGIGNLNFAERDATVIADICRNPQIGGYMAVLLKDKTSEEILRRTEEIIIENPGAFVLFFYSGHGRVTDNGKLYLAARNTIDGRLHSSGVSVASILDLKEAHGCARFAMILDCCYAGLATADFKGASQDQFNSLLGSRGVFFLGAAAATQAAREDIDLKHGVLSSAIIDGLLSGVADIDGDGQISGADLFAHCCRYVVQYSRQEPICVNRVVGGELILAHVATPRSLSQGDIARLVHRKLAFCRANRLLSQSELVQLESYFSKAGNRPTQDTFEHGFMRFAIDEILLSDFLKWYRPAQAVSGSGVEQPKRINGPEKKNSKGEHLKFQLLSFGGRVSRSTYWKVNLGIVVICSACFVLLSVGFDSIGSRLNLSFPLAYAMITSPAYWVSFANVSKRLHDMDRGWGWLVPPVALSSLTAIIQVLDSRAELELILSLSSAIPLAIIGVFRGQSGSNKYGPDPLSLEKAKSPAIE